MKTKFLFTLSLGGLLLCSCGGHAVSSASSAPSSEPPVESSASTPSSDSSSAPIVSSSSATSTASTLPEIDYVQVFCETKWTHIYAWNDRMEKILGNWPGAGLKNYDANWKTYDFKDVSVPFNVIFSVDRDQTDDLRITETGYWWFYQNQWYREDPLAPQETSSSSEESQSSAQSSSSSSTPSSDLDNRHRTWYQLLVYSFADGSGDGIGDFKGIVNHLDYLKKLGIGGIWLSPCHPSADYHGYDVKDYYSIDSKYEQGGVNFAKLLEECHKRDIRVLMDMVLNHTSNQHPWCSQHPDWYSGEHVFSGSMPDLNYDNQAVRTEIKKIGKYWLDKGVDGFRCDGAAWIYGGGGSWNVEQDKFTKTIQWWSEYSSYLKSVKSDVYLVGEVWTDLQYIEQFYESGMSAFNFSASYWAKDAMNNSNPVKWVEECVGHQSRVRQKDSNGVEASFLSNHDTGRFASQMGDKSNLMLANALNVMSPGGAFVYYGDELGMTGSAEGYTDQGYRTPMPFASGRTNGQSYMWKNANTNTVSGKTADADSADSSSMYASLAKVINFKNANPTLYSGQVSQINSGNNSVGVMKYAGGSESYYLVLNTTGNKQSVNVSGDFEKAFTFDSNGSVSVSSNKVELPGRSFAVLKASGNLSFSA